MKETPNHKLRYPEPSDPDTLAAYYENLAEDTERELDAIGVGQLVVPGGAGDAGKILVVQDTGALAYKAMGGDGTIDKDGNFQLGAGVVGTNELGAKVVTPAKIDDSAVTEAKHADRSVTSRKMKPTLLTRFCKNSIEPAEGAYTNLLLEEGNVEVTPDVTSILKVTAIFKFEAAENARIWGTINVDEVDQGPQAELDFSVGEVEESPPIGDKVIRATCSQVYAVELSAGVKHTIRMRAQKLSGSSANARVLATHTRILCELVAA